MPHMLYQSIQLKIPSIHLLTPAIAFFGHEVLDNLFEFTVTFEIQENLDLKSLLKQSIGIELCGFNQHTLIFHGEIQQVFLEVYKDQGGHEYQIIFTPQLSQLTLASDYHIYQHLTTLDIVVAIFRKFEFTDYDMSQLQKEYPQHLYCVQYNETYYDFIRRLLKDADIHFYFRHDAQKHVLVLIDNISQFASAPTIQINSWKTKIEFPISANTTTYHATTTDAALHVGMLIPESITGKSILIHSILHRALAPNTYARDGNIPFYKGEFSAATTLPQQDAKNPNLNFMETATVTAAEEQYLSTTPVGELKVHFHWDRSNKSHLNSSRWLQVGQDWASLSNKACFLPHVDQEALIIYENGDPNKPCIIGAFYNGDMLPPFNLKKNPETNGIRTVSTDLTNSRYHEIRFDNKQSAECFYQQATNDMQINVNGDYHKKIHGQQTIHITSGKQLHQFLKGKSYIAASEIKLQVGQSLCHMTTSGIRFTSAKIKLQAPGGNALPAARLHDAHQCPEFTPSGQPHQGGPILHGSSNVFINGKPAARINDQTKCQQTIDTIKTGSKTVRINNQAAARAEDMTQHGGVIIQGSPDVWMG